MLPTQIKKPERQVSVTKITKLTPTEAHHPVRGVSMVKRTAMPHTVEAQQQTMPLSPGSFTKSILNEILTPRAATSMADEHQHQHRSPDNNMRTVEPALFSSTWVNNENTRMHNTDADAAADADADVSDTGISATATSIIATLKDDFEKRRQDRDRLVDDFKKIINEQQIVGNEHEIAATTVSITNTTIANNNNVIKSNNHTAATGHMQSLSNVAATVGTVGTVGTAGTAVNDNAPTVAERSRDVIRRNSDHNIRLNSTNSVSTPKKRQKFHDPIETRKFMREQKRKRSAERNQSSQVKLNRDVIQERLADLNKKTRKLIGTNARKLKKSSATSATIAPTIVESQRSRHCSPHNVPSHRAVESVKSATSISASQPIAAVPCPYPVCDKIGILRKPDDLVLVKCSLEPFTVPDAVHNYPVVPIALTVPDTQLVVRTRDASVSAMPMPDTNIDNKEQIERLPANWLTNTNVHAYPYNFIMAVRKKLEAITNPVAVPEDGNTVDSGGQARQLSTKAKLRSAKLLNLLQSIPVVSQGKRNTVVHIGCKTPCTQESEPEHPAGKSHSALSQSYSELVTNFSSISLNMAESNTVSEVSSIRSEAQDHSKHPPIVSDDTSENSIQSVIASIEASPVKQKTIVSPLSVDKVAGLKLQSPSKSQQQHQQQHQHQHQHQSIDAQHSFVNNLRGSGEPCAQEFADKISFIEKNMKPIKVIEAVDEELKKPPPKDELIQQNTTDMNYHKMLEAFNRSLSHAIEVNKQLHSILMSRTKASNKTPIAEDKTRDVDEDLAKLQMLRSKNQQSATATSSSAHYTDEFEENRHESSERKDSSSSSGPTRSEIKLIQSDSNTLTFISGKENSVTPRIPSNKLIQEQTDGTEINKQIAVEAGNTTAQDANLKSPAGDLSRSHKKDTEDMLNSTIGSDIFAMFNHTDVEVSLISGNATVLSEANFSYSSIGWYDQMINTEVKKSDHLTSLMRIREKALIDRTKGQIAWLELQKQKYKERGQHIHLSAIKKKQRGILMRLEKDRAALQKDLKKETETSNDGMSSHLKMKRISANLSIRRSHNDSKELLHRRQAIRGYEVERNQDLEQMLLKREQSLRDRREQVDRLIRWHQQLDIQEQEVIEMEEMLMRRNVAVCSIPSKGIDTISNETEAKCTKKIKQIEKSLRVLQNISTTSFDESGETVFEDIVQASGEKLNKLWHRLTGRNDLKYDPRTRYHLNKTDLERLYEEAKRAVLAEFGQTNIISDDTLKPAVGNEPKDDDSTDHEEVPAENKTFNVVVSHENENKADDNLGAAEEAEPIYTEDEFHSSANSLSIRMTEVSAEETSDQAISTMNLEFPSQKTISVQSGDESDILGGYYFSDESEKVQTQAAVQLITEQSPNTSTEPPKNNLTFDQPLIEDMSFPHFELSLPEEDETQHESQTHANDFFEAVVSQDHWLDNSSESKTEISVEEMVVTSSPFSAEEERPTLMSPRPNSTELEQRLISIDESLKDLELSFERVPIELRNRSPSELLSHSESSSYSQHEIVEEIEANSHDEVSVEQQPSPLIVEEVQEQDARADSSSSSSSSSPLSPLSPSSPSSPLFETEDIDNQAPKNEEAGSASGARNFESTEFKIPNRMPDIISEAEVLRRQQLQIEQEIKQLEKAVPYVFLREIPNKPPPPYVPPAHGSPMTVIFPTEERIHEIVYRRSQELYEHESDQNSSTTVKLEHSILDENITNVYERIILDICKECVDEMHPSVSRHSCLQPRSFRRPLAFYNPPDRLLCLQEFVLKRVKRLFNIGTKPVRPPPSALLGCSRRKRDHIDEILVQEMVENESKWTNFDIEEVEVISDVTNSVMAILMQDLLTELESEYIEKFSAHETDTAATEVQQ